MREMKDSGVEWVGQIPKDWEKTKIKTVCSFVGSGTTPASNIIEYYDNGTIDWIQSGDIYGKNNIDEVKTKITTLALNSNTSLRIYKAPYIVMAMYGGSVGNTAISHIDACTNQACCCIKTNENANLSYMYYWLLLCKEDFLIRAEGGGQPNISQDKIKNQYFFVSNYAEQKKIADFLDKKCSEIDTLTSDIQKQIDILEQYKKSVIMESVTKGLNPDAEMKDSGVEWIGQIPVSWGNSKIKYLFNSGKGLSITKENLIESGLAVISYGQIHSKTNTGTDIKDDLIRYVKEEYQYYYPNCRVYKNDFIFADTSEDYDGCGNCVYKRDDTTLFAGYHSIILHSRVDRDNRYLAYLFKTDCWRKQIRETASGVKLFSVTQKKLINSSVILPPNEEQKKIADFLDKKCSEIDTIISDKKKQLEVITEYKKSLIYEYVTGKKEVM